MDQNMSGSTRNPSKRRSADQRPSSAKRKKQTHVALAQAFLRKDYGFRPPPGLREDMSVPARTQNVSPKKRIRPANPNGRDPFQHLNDDEIKQIIGYLKAEDTEILRRVSKFWKAISEFHCGKSVLLQHLPWAASHELDSWSNEEINLYYRRQLYLYENLQRGTAARAIRVIGVHDWHLNSNCLIFCNGSDQASIRTLRTGTAAGIPISSGDEPIHLDQDTRRSSQELPYLQLTNDGNVLAVFRSFASKTDFKDSISLITAQRGQQWHLPLEGSICKPAIGKAAVYFIEAQQNRQNCLNKGPAFKKISLVDGSLLYATSPPEIEEAGVFLRQDQAQRPFGGYSKVESPTHGRKIEIGKFDTSLKLAGNETIAVWSDLRLRVYVFCAATGQVLFTYNRSKHSVLRVSTVTPQVWDICSTPDIGIDFMRLTSYNERTEGWDYAFGFGNFRRASHYAETQFIDADYPIGFNLRHSMTIVDEDTRDPFTTIATEVVKKKFKMIDGQSRVSLEPLSRWSNQQDTLISVALVTLPPKKGQTERRLLEVETPWVVGKDDFFGLVQGYLVYHSFTDKELFVIDFWPEW